MISTAIVVESTSPIKKNNYSVLITPEIMNENLPVVNQFSFSVTDISTLYHNIIQSELQLSNNLSTHAIIENDIIHFNRNSSINFNNFLHITEDNSTPESEPLIESEEPSGSFQPENENSNNSNNSRITNTNIFVINIIDYNDVVIEKTILNNINPELIHAGNIGSLVRLDKQPAIFEAQLSLKNCVGVLDNTNLNVNGLNVIYSFEVFVEFGRRYDMIATINTDLIQSIGFVDAYPKFALNSLLFDSSTGTLKGTINFLDTVSYIVELENNSAVVIILRPKLPLPL